MENNEKCSICLDNINDDELPYMSELILQTPCNHIYHRDCFESHSKICSNSHQHTFCCLCKYKFTHQDMTCYNLTIPNFIKLQNTQTRSSRNNELHNFSYNDNIRNTNHHHNTQRYYGYNAYVMFVPVVEPYYNLSYMEPILTNNQNNTQNTQYVNPFTNIYDSIVKHFSYRRY